MDESLTCAKLLSEAIGTPEPGALNFTALQQLLLVILRKLGLENEPFGAIESNAAEAGPSSAQKRQDDSESVELKRLEFEESEAYQQLLASMNELQIVVESLKHQVLEQKRISSTVLPTTEQLDEYKARRTSMLHPAHENSFDILSLAARLDTIDQSIGKLTTLAVDSTLEYSRMEKSLQPYLDGGELATIRGQLDNINQLLKANFPDYRSSDGCGTSSVLRPPRPSNMEGTVPTDFYQHPVPSSIKPRTFRRSTKQHHLAPDLETELDTIRVVLSNLVARLPLAESKSTLELAAVPSSQSLELATNSIRSIWPHEIEELLRSSLVRIAGLESCHERCLTQLEDVQDDIGIALDHEIAMVNTTVECNWKMCEKLMESLKKKVDDIDERLSEECAENRKQIFELQCQLEGKIDFELIDKLIDQQSLYDRVKEVRKDMDDTCMRIQEEVRLILDQNEEFDERLDGKSEKTALECLESRWRCRFTSMEQSLDLLRVACRQTVEAAGTTVSLRQEPLLCVSCNHEATMKSKAELIPTGKAVRAAEEERKQRIAQLNKLVSKIACGNTGMDKKEASNKKQKSTVKANMEQPDNLAYKVHSSSADDL